MSVEAYQDLLLQIGIPFEAPRKALSSICERFMRSTRLGVLGDKVNVVAAMRPDATCAIWLGFFSTGGARSDGMLVLPPNRRLLEDVRDALWVEGDSVRKAWSTTARLLATHLELRAAELGDPLGPRSPLCHQEKVLAAVPSDMAPHEHTTWSRVKVDLPNGLGFPDPSFLSFDVCRECGVTANAATRFGVALIEPTGRHRHEWSGFSSLLPDVKGVAGVVDGEVCLAPRGPGLHPGACLAVRGARVRVRREAVLSVMPAWTRLDKPILRRVLAIPRGHRHVWEEGRVDFASSASIMTLRCVTCSAELWSNKVWGETLPELMAEFRRRIGRTGGFARTPSERLREVGRELKTKWGPYLGQYSDALAMIACRDGLTDPTDAERQQAQDVVVRSRQQAIEAFKSASTEFWREQLDDETLEAWVEQGFVTREQAKELRA